MCLTIDKLPFVKIPDTEFFKAYKVLYENGTALYMKCQYYPGVHTKQTCLKKWQSVTATDENPAIYVWLTKPEKVDEHHRLITVWVKRTDVIQAGYCGDTPAAKVERIVIHPDDWNEIE